MRYKNNMGEVSNFSHPESQAFSEGTLVEGPSGNTSSAASAKWRECIALLNIYSKQVISMSDKAGFSKRRSIP